MAGMARCYRLLQLLVLGAWALEVTVGDNGVEDGISDICMDCIRRVLPSPEVVCLPHPDYGQSDRCGVFKMTQAFYTDCLEYMKQETQNITDDWNTWKKCYEDDECGKNCVRAYHNRYTSRCASGKSNGKEPLTCADYGQIHSMGATSCGKPESVATGFINNMTLLCGCQTVHANRSMCLLEQEKPLPQCDGVSQSTFTATVVGIVCGAVLVIVGLIIALCCSQKRNKGIVAQTGSDLGTMEHEAWDVDGVKPQSLHNRNPADRHLEQSSPTRMYYTNSPSIEDHQKIKLEEARHNSNTAGSNTNGQALADNNDLVSLSTARPPTVEPSSDVENYYSSPNWISGEGDSASNADADSSLNKARAPIAVP